MALVLGFAVWASDQPDGAQAYQDHPERVTLVEMAPSAAQRHMLLTIERTKAISTIRQRRSGEILPHAEVGEPAAGIPTEEH
jgi:hypothetical protein